MSPLGAAQTARRQSSPPRSTGSSSNICDASVAATGFAGTNTDARDPAFWVGMSTDSTGELCENARPLCIALWELISYMAHISYNGTGLPVFWARYRLCPRRFVPRLGKLLGSK